MSCKIVILSMVIMAVALSNQLPTDESDLFANSERGEADLLYDCRHCTKVVFNKTIHRRGVRGERVSRQVESPNEDGLIIASIHATTDSKTSRARLINGNLGSNHVKINLASGKGEDLEYQVVIKAFDHELCPVRKLKNKRD